MFEESFVGEASDFISLFGLTLKGEKNYFTFTKLLDAPTYSLAGSTYLGAPAISTFEGNPWDVMRENKLVYNFNTGLVVSRLTITEILSLDISDNYFITPGLILPGSLTADGSRVKDYSAWFLRDSFRWKYSEVTYV